MLSIHPYERGPQRWPAFQTANHLKRFVLPLDYIGHSLTQISSLPLDGHYRCSRISVHVVWSRRVADRHNAVDLYVIEV